VLPLVVSRQFVEGGEPAGEEAAAQARAERAGLEEESAALALGRGISVFVPVVSVGREHLHVHR
jgi:hypothetical protein